VNLVVREDEELLLELLNTTPIADGVRVDHLADLGAAQEWAAEHGGVGTADEVTRLREARAAIQDVVSGLSPAQTLDPHLEHVTMRPRLRDGVLGWELGVSAEEKLAARALLAWAAIHERAPNRLRPCANGECHRFLLDRSNANTAQWCSMALCGNRLKARRHYRRTRTTTRE
jgi:predicted RNA-binding Zn ribbon-like protein